MRYYFYCRFSLYIMIIPTILYNNHTIPATKSMISCVVMLFCSVLPCSISFTTTNAVGRSPATLSNFPTTATSSTPGYFRMTASSSEGDTLIQSYYISVNQIMNSNASNLILPSRNNILTFFTDWRRTARSIVLQKIFFFFFFLFFFLLFLKFIF